MDDITPPEAKSVTAGVRQIPFGMPALDAGLGGLPSGTSVLLAGAPDAGADAFVYTHAAQLMLAKHEPGLYPSDVREVRDAIPERVVYVSLGTAGRHVLNAMDSVLDGYQFDALVERLTLLDYSGAFLDLVDTPPAFEEAFPEGGPLDAVERRNAGDSFSSLLESVAADLDERGRDAVVVVDSLSDLYLARRFGLDEPALLGFFVALREMAVAWRGLVHVLYNQRAEAVRADQVLNNLLHGNAYFYSNDQGFDTYRTMRVGSFGGALDRETQVVFGTSIGAAGFRVKSTKKVGPSNW
jgi:KaiC/GvpD/RAD55 family RecA-like ATPase